MPKPWQSGFKRLFYNLNIKRTKSNQKHKKTINHIIMLAKKLDKEGMTSWTAHQLDMVQKKILKYRITEQEVHQSLDHKKLKKLKKIVSGELIFADTRSGQQLHKKRTITAHKEPSYTVITGATSKKAPAKKPTSTAKKTPSKTTTTKASTKKATTNTKTPAKTKTSTSSTKKTSTKKTTPQEKKTTSSWTKKTSTPKSTTTPKK